MQILPPRVSHQSQQAVGKRRSQDSQALSCRVSDVGKRCGIGRVGESRALRDFEEDTEIAR